MNGLRQTLLMVVPFAVALAVMWVISRRRRLSLREDVRLVWPPASVAAAWLIGWAIYVTVKELVSTRLGLPPPKPWAGLGLAARVIRTVGIVLLAPATEELAFRGFLFRAIERTRLGAHGAVLITALAFAALHVQYFGPELVQILLEGLVLGLARWGTRSVLLTAVMHALGNGLAAYQRLTGVG